MKMYVSQIASFLPLTDIFICATVMPDQEGGVLGFGKSWRKRLAIYCLKSSNVFLIFFVAGPEYARFEEKMIPFIGYMFFDELDIGTLMSQGQFDNVVVSSIIRIVKM